MFADGYEKSLKFSKHFARVADAYGCDFLDASEVISSSPVDGIHLGRGEHEKLGQAVVEITKKLLI
jgi:hypothetical protein